MFYVEESQSGQIHLQDALPVPRGGNGANVVVGITSRPCSKKVDWFKLSSTVKKFKPIPSLRIHKC